VLGVHGVRRLLHEPEVELRTVGRSIVGLGVDLRHDDAGPVLAHQERELGARVREIGDAGDVPGLREPVAEVAAWGVWRRGACCVPTVRRGTATAQEQSARVGDHAHHEWQRQCDVVQHEEERPVDDQLATGSGGTADGLAASVAITAGFDRRSRSRTRGGMGSSATLARYS